MTARLVIAAALAAGLAGCTEAPAWTFDGNGTWTTRGDTLVLERAGVPEGQIRRPAALALRSGDPVDDFVLDVNVRSTAPVTTVHRDVLVVWGYRSPTEFRYAHLSAVSDEIHNAVMEVENADRRRLSVLPDTALLVDRAWHRVRVTRTWPRVEVSFDGRPLLVATDSSRAGGLAGVGSFDDTAEFTGFRLVPVQPRR